MSPIPNAERAVIEPAKIRDYVLSRQHAVGRFKAVFFESLGYEESSWRSLADDLRGQHLACEPAEVRSGEHGTKYVVRAILTGPSGKAAALVSVWIVRTREDFPRFVTAYPGEP